MTFTIEYRAKSDLVAKLRTALNEHEEWIAPGMLAHRYLLTPTAMFMRLARWQRDGVIAFTDDDTVRRGPSGRMLLLKLTPELRALMEARE